MARFIENRPFCLFIKAFFQKTDRGFFTERMICGVHITMFKVSFLRKSVFGQSFRVCAIGNIRVFGIFANLQAVGNAGKRVAVPNRVKITLRAALIAGKIFRRECREKVLVAKTISKVPEFRASSRCSGSYGFRALP